MFYVYNFSSESLNITSLAKSLANLQGMRKVVSRRKKNSLFLDTQFQVAASMRKDADAQIPSYPNLPSKLICILHSVTMQVIQAL
jgi:hypothetical protein